MQYVYPARLVQHKDTVLVSFRDLPEAVTEGRTRAEALVEAADCLDVAMLFRIKEATPLSPPSMAKRGEILVAASPHVAAKAAFARAFTDSGLTRVALAAILGVRETEVRRMLDPDHGTRLERLNEGMRALGRQLIVADQPADAA